MENFSLQREKKIEEFFLFKKSVFMFVYFDRYRLPYSLDIRTYICVIVS